ALVSMPWPTELLMVQQVSDRQDEIKLIETQQTKNRPVRPGTRRGPGAFPGDAGGGTFNRRFGGPRTSFGARRTPFGGNRTRFGQFGGNRGFGGPMEDMFDAEGMGPMGGYYEGQSAEQGNTSSWEKAMSDFFVAKVG